MQYDDAAHSTLALFEHHINVLKTSSTPESSATPAVGAVLQRRLQVLSIMTGLADTMSQPPVLSYKVRDVVVIKYWVGTLRLLSLMRAVRYETRMKSHVALAAFVVKRVVYSSCLRAFC